MQAYGGIHTCLLQLCTMLVHAAVLQHTKSYRGSRHDSFSAHQSNRFDNQFILEMKMGM